jgi:hypothetical protein
LSFTKVARLIKSLGRLILELPALADRGRRELLSENPGIMDYSFLVEREESL